MNVMSLSSRKWACTLSLYEDCLEDPVEMYRLLVNAEDCVRRIKSHYFGHLKPKNMGAPLQKEVSNDDSAAPLT